MKKPNFKEVYNIFENNFPNLTQIEIEKSIEQIFDFETVHSFEYLIDWYSKINQSNPSKVEIIDTNQINLWEIDEFSNLKHQSGSFFQIKGIRTTNSIDREVGKGGWDQPIIIEKNNEGGLLGLIRTKINDVPHYLVEAKFEPGNYNHLQLSPTLQATHSNINKAHGGKEPTFLSYFLDCDENNSDYIFNQLLSEDGGRFYKKRNRGLVKNVNFEKIDTIPENFNWFSLFQLRKILHSDSIVNPHLARLIFLF